MRRYSRTGHLKIKPSSAAHVAVFTYVPRLQSESNGKIFNNEYNSVPS